MNKKMFGLKTTMKDRNRTNIDETKSLKKYDHLFYGLLSIGIGFIIGFIILASVGNSAGSYIEQLWNGSFSSYSTFGNFLGTYGWMLVIGASMMVSFRAKLFNIGSAGQMMLGGIVAYLIALTFPTGHRGSTIFFIIVGSVVVGGLFAMFIGWLKSRFGVHEVVTSIMLNWVVYWLYMWLTNVNNNAWLFTSGNGTATNTLPIAQSLQSPGLSGAFPSSTINLGIFIGIAVIIIFWFMYKFTTWGYRQDVFGSNPQAAKYIGLNEKREVVKTMTISGALAGLAGAIYYTGVMLYLPVISNSIPSFLFQGITVSLIGFNSPIGILFSSALLSTMQTSSSSVSTVASPYITNFIVGIIVWLVAISNFFIIYKPLDKWIGPEANAIGEMKRIARGNERIEYLISIKQLNSIIPEHKLNDKIYFDELSKETQKQIDKKYKQMRKIERKKGGGK